MRGKMDCHGASDIGLKRKLNTVIVSRLVDSNSAAELVVETAENSVEAEFDPMTDTLPTGEQKLVEPQTATERTTAVAACSQYQAEGIRDAIFQ